VLKYQTCDDEICHFPASAAKLASAGAALDRFRVPEAVEHKE